MASRPSPPLEYVQREGPKDAQTINISFGKPFSSIYNVYCWTIIKKYFPLDLGSICCMAFCLLMLQMFFTSGVVTCWQIQTRLFWITVLCVRVCLSRTFIAFAQLSFHCERFLSWKRISPEEGYAICELMHLRVSPKGPPAKTILLSQQKNVLTAPNLMGAKLWIDELL